MRGLAMAMLVVLCGCGRPKTAPNIFDKPLSLHPIVLPSDRPACVCPDHPRVAPCPSERDMALCGMRLTDCRRRVNGLVQAEWDRPICMEHERTRAKEKARDRCETQVILCHDCGKACESSSNCIRSYEDCLKEEFRYYLSGGSP